MQQQPKNNMEPKSAENYANKHSGRAYQAIATNTFRQHLSNFAPATGYVRNTTANKYPRQNAAFDQFHTPYALRPTLLPQYPHQIHQQVYCSYFVQKFPQPAGIDNSRNPVSLNSDMQSGKYFDYPTTTGNRTHLPFGVDPMLNNTTLPVGVPPFAVMPHQTLPQKQPKLRRHALQIIDPVTRRNILDDLDMDKNTPLDTAIESSTLQSAEADYDSSLDLEMCAKSLPPSKSVPVTKEPNETIIDDTVEKNTTSKTPENIGQVTDDVQIDTASFNCKQPQNLIDQEQKSPKENTPLQSPLPMPNDNSLACQEEREKNCRERSAESVRIMQLEENESLTLPQQIKSHDCSEQQAKLEPKESSSSTESKVTLNTAKENIKTKKGQMNKMKGISNEKKISPNKTVEKLDKSPETVKKAKNSKKTKKTASKGNAEAATQQNKAMMSKEPTIIKVETVNEKDNASMSPKEDENKQTIENSTILITSNEFKETIESCTILITSSEYKETIESSTILTTSNEFKEAEISKPELLLENPAISKAEEDANGSSKCDTKINCNDEQSSTCGLRGKKQYTYQQLIQLSEAKASNSKPIINSLMYEEISLPPTSTFRGRLAAINRNISKFNKYRNRGRDNSGDLYNQNVEKPVVHLNLELDQDVKLKEADNAWRPRILTKSTDSEADSAQRENEELTRRVRGILNKLTPEKFEPLVEEVISLKIDTMDKMETVMILVFEKAVDEPNFSVSYASLCQRLVTEIKSYDEKAESGSKCNLASFHRSLLAKAEQEFTQNVTQNKLKQEKLMPIREKIKNCTDANKKAELKDLLEEEDRKIRRRSGGTVRFIGELFKLSMLTGKIINFCIEALLKDPNNEDMLECLCKLLTTVGQKFEDTNIPKTDSKYSLDNVIKRIQNIAAKNSNFKVSSRIRFMLQDVIDLRKQNWQSKRTETPKTMKQIEKEVIGEKIGPSHYYDMKASNVPSDYYSGRYSQSSDSLKRHTFK